MERDPAPRGAVKQAATGLRRGVARLSGDDEHEKTASSTAVKNTRRLAVIEDSYAHLRLIMHAYRERGYQLDHFATINDAWDALSTKSYTALIVGDTMAGGEAACAQTIERIRGATSSALAALPIIALAGRGKAERVRELGEIGASAVLREINEDRLAATLSAVLDKSTGGTTNTSSSGRVLLIEDSYSVSVLLSDAVARAGRDIDHVDSMAQGIAALDTAHYDVVIIGRHDTADSPTVLQFLEYANTLSQRGKGTTHVWLLAADLPTKKRTALRRAGAARVIDGRNHAQLIEQIATWLIDKAYADHATDGVQSKSKRERADSFFRAARRFWSLKEILQSVRRATIYGIAGVFIGTGVWLSWRLFEAKTPVEVVSARYGVVERVVSGTGHWTSKRQVDLPPVQTGQIFRVFAREGELARKGEVLASLDNREATINVRRAEAEVFRYKTEIDLADKTLHDERSDASPAAPNPAMVELRSSHTLAKAKWRVAQQDLRAAQLSLEKLSISAPFAGLVARSSAVEGKWVQAGEPVFSLVDMAAGEIVMRVEERAAQAIAEGQIVHVQRIGADAEQWDEAVTRVAQDDAGGGALVSISIGDQSPVLPYGQRVDVSIVTEAVSESLVVPNDAVMLHEGKYYIAVDMDGLVARRQVDVALQGTNETAIRSGLREGEQVIIGSAHLHEGQRVAVKSNFVVSDGRRVGDSNIEP